jgi:hypothetical protein
MNVKAVPLDRDGIINEFMYYPEHGIIDSPFTPEQLRLKPFAVEAVNHLYLNVIRELHWLFSILVDPPQSINQSTTHILRRVIMSDTALQVSALIRNAAARPESELRRMVKVIYIKIHPRDPRVAQRLVERWIEKCVKFLEKADVVKLAENGPSCRKIWVTLLGGRE